MRKLFTNIASAFVIGSMVFLVSCSESTDPLPISKADFKITSVAPEINVPVQFENLSLNASAYVWDYGDGMKDSLVIDPEHTYDTEGLYTVKMTAYTEDGQMSEAIQDISVGKRYLTEIVILNVNMVDENGDSWDDDGSGPDVLLEFRPEEDGNEEEYITAFIDSVNVSPNNNTPIFLTLTEDYEMMNKNYLIILSEVNIVDDDGEQVPEFRDMAGFMLNPIAPESDFITVTKREDGTGDIVIPFAVINQYQCLINFEIR